MTEAKFTPGPWYLDDQDCIYAKVKEGEPILAVLGGAQYGGWLDRDDGGDAEFSNNMRLMHAAPELYEALEAAEDALAEHCAGLTYLLDDVIAPALAKARGEGV